MKCNNCGYEAEGEFAYCPSCGSSQNPVVAEAPAEPVNTAATRVLTALKDKLFLALCILVSVSCAMTLFSSGPDVISILFTIFLWLTFAKAQQGVADEKYLRCISGTYYAHYVILNVAAIIMIVAGILCSSVLNVLLADESFVGEISGMLDGYAPGVGSQLSGLFTAGLGILFMIIFILAGVIMLLINLFSNRYIHRFAKSVYQSIEAGQLQLQHINAAYGWLWVFGIFSGISCLSNLASGNVLLILSSGTNAAASIIAALLVKKHLLDAPQF